MNFVITNQAIEYLSSEVGLEPDHAEELLQTCFGMCILNSKTRETELVNEAISDTPKACSSIFHDDKHAMPWWQYCPGCGERLSS